MFIETNCVLEHNGQKIEANGAYVDDSRIVAYLGRNGVLTDWHGDILGTYYISATWPTPQSYVSDVMHQVYAKVNGVWYTGRSSGVGMVFTGKRTKRVTHWRANKR